MPSYRLPQNLGCRKILDEVGMHSTTKGEAANPFPTEWIMDDNGECVQTPSICPTAASTSSVAQPASYEEINEDAGRFALSYCRDFRALHQFNHDHDCTHTCIKYLKNQCKEAAENAIRKGKVVLCRFFFFHIKVFSVDDEAGNPTTKRIRRRGKALVEEPYIAITNERNEFCKPILQRDTPFRSASTDVGQNWGRCNVDFQFMPRTIDPSYFMESSTEQPAVLQVNPKDAVAMYGVRMQMPDAPMLRRIFHTMVAMFQAAYNCDYYITKYHCKPTAQLQSLFMQMALGLRRLEAEQEHAQSTGEPPVNAAAERARKTVLKIASAGNRSTWCSCCEMASFIKTGALARRTHRPNAIFLSRPMFLYEQCRRLLQSTAEMLIEAQMPCDDEARHVDVLCFTTPNTAGANGQDEPPDNEADNHSAVQPAAVEADPKEPEIDGDMISSEEENFLDENRDVDNAHAQNSEALNEDGDAEESDSQEMETDSAAQPAEMDIGSAARAAQAGPEQDAVPPGEAMESGAQPADTAEAFEEDLDITALEATTSAHDDWLHRGSFLFNMDFYTYMRFTIRKPRPKEHKVSDADRAEHCFLFDAHYALANSHWQQLVTEGHAKLVVMEALKCPLPSLNNGEDNAVFKSLIGTLIKCPGPGHCADPLFCKAGFFQDTVAQSSKQTDESELPDWIDHTQKDESGVLMRRRCPLVITRKTHADNVAPTYSCRLQWKARRAEIEVLASQAARRCHDAQRIPVLADTTLLRGFFTATGASQTGHTLPQWRLLLCLNQMWESKCGQAFPPFAPKVLNCLGHSIHHPHQMSLAQFSAYYLGQVIYHLDMLGIARTTKLTATAKEKIDDECTEEVKASGPPLETEFYGGEHMDEPEDDEVGAEAWRPMFPLPLQKVNVLLSRQSEVAAASKKGPKPAAVRQMACFDLIYHSVLTMPLPQIIAKANGIAMHCYGQASSTCPQ